MGNPFLETATISLAMATVYIVLVEPFLVVAVTSMGMERILTYQRVITTLFVM